MENIWLPASPGNSICFNCQVTQLKIKILNVKVRLQLFFTVKADVLLISYSLSLHHLSSKKSLNSITEMTDRKVQTRSECRVMSFRLIVV